MAASTCTARLRLEPVGPQHVEDIAAMLADPAVGATMGGVRERAYTAERTLIHAEQWRLHGFGLWAAFSLTDGAFVGRGGIQHTILEGLDVVEAGWCLIPSRWGQGFATELGRAGLELGFTRWKLPEIVAFTLPHNTASRAVMERLGMTHQRDCLHGGLPHVVYSISRAG